MNWKMRFAALVAGLALSVEISFPLPALAADGPVTITVQVDKPGAKINPAMWGAFFEDINFGADGGLYAQMVKNGGFDFPEPLAGWFKIIPSLAKGEITVLSESPAHDVNPHYLRIQSTADAPLG